MSTSGRSWPGASLHRLRLLADGLSQEALSTTRSEIERQLARSSST